MAEGCVKLFFAVMLAGLFVGVCVGTVSVLNHVQMYGVQRTIQDGIATAEASLFPTPEPTPYFPCTREHDQSTQGRVYSCTLLAELAGQSTGIELCIGTSITVIYASGEWTHQAGVIEPYSAEGSTFICSRQSRVKCSDPIPTFPRGALIAKAHENWLRIGGSRYEYTHDTWCAKLIMGMNDDNFADNDGAVTVKVIVQ